ncbi:MAG: DUF6804 family protein [Thermaurantiacus tibetensis]|uniref:DUF6804 family protein n=1 Tax=Thermaurantiacus tibetensis TaxID=2759035 RepID=UPI002E2BAE22|nr:DUF6804 family protein [Thermaurantiacus tibetensis]
MAVVPNAVWFIPCAGLLVALTDMPYGFYTLLRFLVCGAAGWLAWAQHARAGRVDSWVVALAVVAVIYNPVLRIRLDRETWEAVNLLTFALFGVHWLRYGRAPR